MQVNTFDTYHVLYSFCYLQPQNIDLGQAYAMSIQDDLQDHNIGFPEPDWNGTTIQMF